MHLKKYFSPVIQLQKIKKIETDYPIYCPFCDELIRGDEEDGPCFYESGECEHLLFVATDCGFEEYTERFCENMNIEILKDVFEKELLKKEESKHQLLLRSLVNSDKNPFESAKPN